MSVQKDEARRLTLVPLLRYAIKVYRQHFLRLTAIEGFALLLLQVTGLLARQLANGDTGPRSTALDVVEQVLTAPLAYGAWCVCLRPVRGEVPRWTDLIAPYRKALWRSILSYVLSLMLLMLVMAVCIVPVVAIALVALGVTGLRGAGWYFAAAVIIAGICSLMFTFSRNALVPYLVVERNRSAFGSVMESWRLTRSYIPIIAGLLFSAMAPTILLLIPSVLTSVNMGPEGLRALVPWTRPPHSSVFVIALLPLRVVSGLGLAAVYDDARRRSGSRRSAPAFTIGTLDATGFSALPEDVQREYRAAWGWRAQEQWEQRRHGGPETRVFAAARQTSIRAPRSALSRGKD